MKTPTVTRPPSTNRQRARPAVMVALCAVLALVIGLMNRPVPTRLPSTHVGDGELAALARDVVGEDRPALAVAVVTPDAVRTAAIGAGLDDRFEAGSISKGLTGLLFQDMIERGEVGPGTRVGDLLDVDGPLGAVTLEQLATHRSGLPPQPTTPRRLLTGFWARLTAGNPHAGTTRQLLDDLRDVELDAPLGTYSNAGFMVLGAALAAAADTSYERLLDERILTPLGMTGAIVPRSADELTARDVPGETAGGRRADPWLGEALAPAGGVRADVTDLAVLARALLVGDAPGAEALTPRETPEGDRIGWAWVTTASPQNGRDVVWHNGATGGFSSFLGLDRTTGTAVVVLSAVGDHPNRPIEAGFELLDRQGGDA